MKIAQDAVVSFHYTLTDEDGQQVESSVGREPLAILYGHGNVIPGVEAALRDQEIGAKLSVNVPPEQGYGARRPDWTQRVPKKYFRDSAKLKPGMQTMLQTQDGPRVVTVAKIGETVVDVDLNHPMAGRTLKFDIEVVDVRAAAPEELAHGHVHGAGGHHH
jgi:FKBP-type peptidyl-prolyl cis-trans isomerase SlyD